MRMILVQERPAGAVQIELHLTSLEAERLQWISSFYSVVASHIASQEFERSDWRHGALRTSMSRFLESMWHLIRDIPGPRAPDIRALWGLDTFDPRRGQNAEAPEEQTTDQVPAEPAEPEEQVANRNYAFTATQPPQSSQPRASSTSATRSPRAR